MNQILCIIYYLFQLLICESVLLRLFFPLYFLFSITSTCLRHLDENLNIFHLHSMFYHVKVLHKFKNRKQKFWTRLKLAFHTHAGPDFPPGIPPPSCNPCNLLTANNITHKYHLDKEVVRKRKYCMLLYLTSSECFLHRGVHKQSYFLYTGVISLVTHS